MFFKVQPPPQTYFTPSAIQPNFFTSVGRAGTHGVVARMKEAIVQGDEEIVQSGKGLLSKREDPSSDP